MPSELIAPTALADAPLDRDSEPTAWRRYAAAAWASNTRRSYRAQWTTFSAWCESRAVAPLPAAPAVVAEYLAIRADGGAAVATLALALAAIAEAHRAVGATSPRESIEVRVAWKGIRRQLGVGQREKAPLLTADLRRVTDALPVTLIGIRDRALLLLGFAGAFRRSELTAIVVADLRFDERGLEVHIRRSKTDQEGRGAVKVIAYGSLPTTCPVRATRQWLAAAGVVEGPAFRSVDRHGHIRDGALDPGSIARIVKRSVAAAGLTPESFSGHSLRSGFVTQAAELGASDRDIMAQTAHRSVAMLRKYDRRRHAWQSPASARLGL